MDIDALRSFLAFAETGSFTRAAKQIHRTQSAFSAQMRKLEEELGVNLFEKDGRNLILSEAGLNLRIQAQQLVELHDGTKINLQRYRDKKPLRLGCPDDYNHTILPKLIYALYRKDPTHSIQIVSDSSVVLRQLLDAGKLDAAVVTRLPDSEEGYWLSADQGVWIARPEFTLNREQAIPLVLFQRDCKYHIAATEGLSKAGLNYQLVACCSSASAQLAIIRSGMAIGAMGRKSVSNDLIILPDLPALPAVDIALVTGSTRHPLIDKALLKSLEKTLKA